MFDGETLVTHADEASRPELKVKQTRRIAFEGPTRIVMIPTSGLSGDQHGMQVVWEKVG